MTYKEHMDQEYKRGKAEGKAEGEEERKTLKNENELLRKEIEQLKAQLITK